MLKFNSSYTNHTSRKYFSLKHPAKYIGKKPRKYIIPAKPLTPMHLQSLSGNSPNETDSGGGNGRVTSNEQVHMYREMSSGALSRATYNKVGITTLQYHTFIFNILNNGPPQPTTIKISIVLDGAYSK